MRELTLQICRLGIDTLPAIEAAPLLLAWAGGGLLLSGQDSIMAKLPHMPFYYKDWMADANLSRCTLASKGVAIDLFCLMWDCDERGKLISAGSPWTMADIRQAVRGPDTEVETCVIELVAKQVVKIDDQRCYYNSRMVKDEELRAIRAKSGSKGGSKTQAKAKAKEKANIDQKPANANDNAIN